jgi:effector-binding domain-containing protein
MHLKLIISIAILIGIFIALIYWQLYAYNAPQPKYRLLKSDGQIEIREYPELVVAEVTIPGERYASINEGFRILAGYIFGNNQRNQTIAMTAPVEQEKGKDGWIIRFIMPNDFEISTLPKPTNHAISFTHNKSKKYIAIRFRGFNTDDNIDSHKNLLLEYIQNNNIKTIGSPIMAFYNPPWILPFLRRNEIIIELQ